MPSHPINRRIWVGYAVIGASLVFSYALWIGTLWQADALYDNIWKYPAKVGSHSTVILMCWAFILATRFRPIEALFGGLDQVYRAHRMIGECAFLLIFLHPLFLAIAYTEAPGDFLRYLWFSGNWVRNTGLIALFAFILLVTLSIYIKIAYHRWKQTHNLFGLLLVLIVLHAILAKGDIVQHPALTVWYGAWVIAGLAAYIYIRFLYRFFGPQYDYRTTKIKNIGDETTEVYIEPVGRTLRMRPGQFVFVSFDADAVSKEPHPFSPSSPPESKYIRLSIKQVGDWTDAVSAIHSGEPVRVWGPYGYFGDQLFAEPGLPVIMIGGGIGITPFLSILGSNLFAERKQPTTLVYTVTDPDADIYASELQQLASRLPALNYQQHFSDADGFIDLDYLEDLTTSPLNDYLFMICGPGPLMDTLQSILTEAGVNSEQILTEAFELRSSALSNPTG